MVQSSAETTWSPTGHADERALEAYVPRLLGDWLGTTPGRAHRAVEGTMVFADISGFTRLTERLSRLGRVGAEEMSDALDATFTELLGEAHAEGADLVKWGGDAVLLLFDGPEHAARGCRAAYRMRARLRSVGQLSTSAGQARLRMSVGVHSGTFDFFLVGDPDLHRELIVCGPDISTVVGIEAEAGAGQIAVGWSACERLDPEVLAAPLGDVGRLLRREPVPGSAAAHPARSADGVDLTGGLPVAIREHLLQGRGEPEHRAIAVAFVAFSGTDRMLREEGPEATVAALDDCIRNVAGAAADHTVTFFESDVNRDGGKIMLTAGAPTSAGHDAERMLRTARLIVERAGRLPLRVGVNQGHVFSGDFGPTFRRTYSVKGDAINVAARLVARAEPGQVLATTELPDHSPTRFALRPVGPFVMKGKARPVPAVDVGPVTEPTSIWAGATGPLVGRDEQVAVLTEAVALAAGRGGGFVDIVGEPGLGKSRLLAEVRGRAEALTVLSVTCDEYESSTPYHAFRMLLRDLLGIRPGTGPEAARARLGERVRDNAPELAQWLPLLGIPLDLTMPDTPQTGDLSDEFRKRRLEEVVADFLHVLLPTPSVLLIDDAQFLDGASADLLHQVAARLPDEPWLVVTARREQSDGWAGPAPSVTTLRLAPLSSEDSIRLLQAAADVRPLPRPTIAALAARAGGNPLFLQSLIEVTDPAGTVLDLPESVQDLVTAQVDRLAPSDRVVLRYASVLGMRFAPEDLTGLVAGHAPPPDEGTYRRLGEFIVTDGAARRFRHALMREVAYQGLPYRTRPQLHDQVGRTLERTDPDGSLEVLSLHFFHAQRFDKAWSYSRQAALRARAKFANQEAVDLFNRAVEAERRGSREAVTATELGTVLEELGDTWFVIGLPEQAADAYRRARRELTDDPIWTARVVYKEARVDQRLRKLPQSLRRVTRALHLLDPVTGPRASGARSWLEMRYAITRFAQGRITDALDWGDRAVRHAEEAVDKPTLAETYRNMHALYLNAGLEAPVPYGELALLAYQELGDLPHQADCTNNLAISAHNQHRWQEAVEMFGRAVVIYRQVGDTQGEGLASCNQAELLIRQGHLDRASSLLAETLLIARSVSDQELEALALRECGRLGCRRGDLAAGLADLARAAAIFEDIEEPEELPATELAVCEGLLLNDDHDGCRARLSSLEPTVDLLPMLHRLRGLALLASGAGSGACEELRRGLAASLEQDDPYSHALCRLGLARAQRGRGAGSSEDESGAWAEFTPLGVVAPAFPRLSLPVGDGAPR